MIICRCYFQIFKMYVMKLFQNYIVYIETKCKEFMIKCCYRIKTTLLSTNTSYNISNISGEN